MFTQLLGEDFLRYVYDKDKGTSVDEHILSTLVDYNHDQWESEYLNQPTTPMQDIPSKGHGPKHPTQDTSQKPAKKICLGNETSQKKVIILDEDDTEEANCSNNGSEHQLSSAISTASTRAELAALATLIPPVSSFAGTSQKPAKKICLGNETSQKKVIILDEDDTEEANCSNNGSEHQLSSAISTASTRAELAALATLIPPVSSFAGSLSPMLGQGAGSDLLFTNPFCVVQRPCQAVIERAEALLTDERKKGNNPFGVVIPGLGQFSKQGLRILKKFCAISETKHKVSSEARWLSDVNCTQRELECLQTVLWNKPTGSRLLVCDHKAIDVLSFSDLTEERYVDSFGIDVSISKYIEESYLKGQEDTLYLPTDIFQWMQVQDKGFKLRKLKERASQVALFENVCQILVPVFMVNHWGLIYVNFSDKHLYFDDGLTSVVPQG